MNVEWVPSSFSIRATHWGEMLWMWWMWKSFWWRVQASLKRVHTELDHRCGGYGTRCKHWTSSSQRRHPGERPYNRSDFTPVRSVTIWTTVGELTVGTQSFSTVSELCWRKTFSVINVVNIFLDVSFLIQYQKTHSRECGKLINMDGKDVNSKH